MSKLVTIFVPLFIALGVIAQTPTPTPTSTATPKPVSDVTLAWDKDADPTVIGYMLYYGTASGTYTESMEAGNVTSVIVRNLIQGKAYYFALTAYNSETVTSAFSNEVKYTIPSGSPTPTPTGTPGQKPGTPANLRIQSK